MNRRDLAVAVAIPAMVFGLTGYLLASPEPVPSVADVTYTIAPTVTVTAQPTSTPTVTRTVTVSRSKPRTVTAIQSRIRWCESRNNYRAQNPASTASGGYGFLDKTWRDVTGLPGSAKDYPPAVQDQAFRDLYADLGTKPWRASRGCWG